MAKAAVRQSGTRSAGQYAKKVQQLDKELDRLIAQFGPSVPGLASVLNGARKLLKTQPPPGLGSKQVVIFGNRSL